MELRDYQLNAIDQLYRGFDSGLKSQLITSPTGSGKTAIAANVIKNAARNRRTSLFVAPLIELIDQTAGHLRNLGLKVAIIQGENTDLVEWPDAVVATVQTINSRGWPPRNLGIGPLEYVFIDECHRLYEVHRKLLQVVEAKFVGLTATPMRKELGKHYEHMIVAATIKELTKNGYLSEAKIYCPTREDMAAVLDTVDIDYTKNDFNAAQLSHAMSQRAIVGDVISTWQKRASDRRTLLFACTIRHAEILCEVFQVEGIDVGIVTCETPKEERKEIISRYRSGNLQVLCSVDALSLGFDVPAVDCLVMARPTLSQTVYIQQAGRGLRIAENKRDVMILDHAANTLRFGPPIHFTPPALGQGEQKATKRTLKERSEFKECPTCDFVMPRGTPTCPECGYDYPVRGSRVIDYPGELQEMDKPPDSLSHTEKMRWYCGFKHIQIVRGYKPGFAWVMYKQKFNETPPNEWKNLPDIQPDYDVANWVKSQMIRYAKRRSAA